MDKTPPSLTGHAVTSPNDDGWYNTDVTVHFEATDLISGVASVTNDTTLSNEGEDQSVEGVAIDNAGNNETYTVLGINIDKTNSHV